MGARKGFTFEPRKLVNRPQAFGSVGSELEPAEGVEGNDPRFLAAQWQHLLANQVREYVIVNGRDVAWFSSSAAGHPGVSVDRMRRMLRGETMMQIADMTLILQLVESAREVVMLQTGFDFTPYQELEKENQQIKEAMYVCRCGAMLKMPERWQDEHERSAQFAKIRNELG